MTSVMERPLELYVIVLVEPLANQDAVLRPGRTVSLPLKLVVDWDAPCLLVSDVALMIRMTILFVDDHRGPGAVVRRATTLWCSVPFLFASRIHEGSGLLDGMRNLWDEKLVFVRPKKRVRGF